MKEKQIDEIWEQRFVTFEDFYANVKSLFKWRISAYHKLGYFQVMWDRFVDRSVKQDKKIREIALK